MDEDNKRYLPIIIGSDGSSFSITNNGTAAAPCRLTIIPKNDLMLITIGGLAQEPITVERVQKNQILIIDGIDRAVTIDGQNAFENFNGWELPKLQPGVNNISISNADLMTISIEYQLRYI